MNSRVKVGGNPPVKLNLYYNIKKSVELVDSARINPITA